MKNLFLYECRKIWLTKWQWVVAAIGLAILLWVVVTGGSGIRALFTGSIRSRNELTRPYWGQVMTEELREIFKQNALALGAEEKTDFGYSHLDPSPVIEKYGLNSEEANECARWCSLYGQPTLAEEQAEFTELYQYYTQRYQNGEIGSGY